MGSAPGTLELLQKEDSLKKSELMFEGQNYFNEKAYIYFLIVVFLSQTHFTYISWKTRTQTLWYNCIHTDIVSSVELFTHTVQCDMFNIILQEVCPSIMDFITK